MKFEFKDPNGVVLYLEVLETFDHYYTKKTVYRCRIHDRNGSCTECTFDQDEFNEILENRIVQPIGYVIFNSGEKEDVIDIKIDGAGRLEFSTNLMRYRVYERVIGESFLMRIPVFDMFNPVTGYWYTVDDIERIEIRNWNNKEKGK